MIKMIYLLKLVAHISEELYDQNFFISFSFEWLRDILNEAKVTSVLIKDLCVPGGEFEHSVVFKPFFPFLYVSKSISALYVTRIVNTYVCILVFSMVGKIGVV